MATHQRSVALMKFLSQVARRLGVAEHVYVVGGAVRNWVINEPIKDIDVVIDPVALKRNDASDWFARAVADAIPVKTSLVTNNYGVAILSITGEWDLGGEDMQGEVIEIANARKESYGGEAGKGYKPHMVEPATIEEDTVRREFTFNTLLWRLHDLADGPDKAEILDLTGCGKRDLQEGWMRCPSDPDKTFSDDPSRMVRAIKFLLKYHFKIAPDVEAAIRRNKDKIRNIPAAHLSNMLINVFFDSGVGKAALLEMDKLGLLEVIRDVSRTDKAFQKALANWADSRASVEFLFDLMDLGMPTGRRLGFLDPSQKARVREITVQMSAEESDGFLSILEQPGKVLDMPQLISDFNLKGAEIRQLTVAVRQRLLEDPTLARRPDVWAERVKSLLGGKTAAGYPGNLGFAEMLQFYKIADAIQQKVMDKLLEQGKVSLAWKLLQKVLHVKLHDLDSHRTSSVVEVPSNFHPVVLVPVHVPREGDEPPFVGFIDFQGLEVDVENKAGDTRSGTTRDGTSWSTYMHAHYGEIRDTEGTDGDNLDVYVGPNHDSSLVVVVHQHKPDSGAYDEDKVLIGFDSIEEAIGLYKKQYDRPGFYVDGKHTAMPMGQFWRWVHDEKNRGKRIKAAQRLAARYLKVGGKTTSPYVYNGISATPWGTIGKDLEKFKVLRSRMQKLITASDPLYTLRDSPLLQKAIDEFLFGEGGHPAGLAYPLGQWILRHWGQDGHKAIEPSQSLVREAAYALFKMVSNDLDEYERVPAADWVKKLDVGLKAYISKVNTFLAQMGDETFTYRGLKVQNPERLPVHVVRDLLDGVDYTMSVFQKRGVLPLFTESVSSLLVREAAESEDRALGWYNWKTRRIEFIARALKALNPRMLKTWVQEIFLHEVGHHIHLNLLHPEAKKEWDSGWAPVEEAQKEQDRQVQQVKEQVEKRTQEWDLKVRAVTHAERLKFWDMLVAAKGNLKRIQLKGIPRMKFHAWLANPMVNNGYVTPKNLRWTSRGVWLSLLLEGDLQALSLTEEARQLRLKTEQENLAVTSDWAGQIHPSLSEDQVQEYKEEDKSVEEALKALQPPIEEAIDALQPVTDYARNNEKEDFAEAFVAFMAAPEKLTPVAKYRMQRALSLSGLYGKPIMKLAGDDVSQALKSFKAKPGERVKLPDRNYPLFTESFDSNDAFAPIVASFEVVDGWVVYQGRNGSEGIVVGPKSKLLTWARQVQQETQARPLAKDALVPWTPEMGGARKVQEAERVARGVLRALGVSADIQFWASDHADLKGGAASGSVLTLENIHKSTRKTSFLGVGIPGHLAVAAHEAAHLGYHKGGAAVLAAMKAYRRAGGEPFTIYHALAGDFEGVMEAAAMYVLAGKQLQEKAPTIYEAVALWFGGRVRLASERLARRFLASPSRGYHVSPSKNDFIIKEKGLSSRGSAGVYVWDTLDMAEWFRDYAEEDRRPKSIWEVDLQGLPLTRDPETRDMSEWSSSFRPGQEGGGWISKAPLTPDRLQKLARCFLARTFTLNEGDPILYGKYKNKHGLIKSFGVSEKGDPTITIEPVPKGRKQEQTINLFKVRYDQSAEAKS